jgi:hypothetical protein
VEDIAYFAPAVRQGDTRKSECQKARLHSDCFSSRFGAPALPGDHDRGAEADPAIKIKDVRIVHADAAIGDEPADRRRVVGAMDGVFALTERERGFKSD